MTTAFDAPHDELDPPSGRGTKIALGVTVLAMIAMWGWIFLFASRDNPDRLATRAFAETAESICAPVQEQIDTLPRATAATSPAERAEQVAAGSELTGSMVDALRDEAATVTDPDDRRLLDAWFDDWDTYLGDRQRFVDRLRAATPQTDRDDLRFTLSEKARGGVYTRTIDGFANVNDMTSCRVPLDVG